MPESPNDRYRYPGSRPFERGDKDLFFGRTQDIAELYKFINVNKLSVLYGKSGYGKSSLVNAGVIPKFEDENGMKSVFIRFGAFKKDEPQSLKAIFAEKTVQNTSDTEGGHIFLSDLENEKISLWQYFKSLQWSFRSAKGLLLVLDQFEEIFTYPENIEDFAREFSELMSNRMPEAFQNKLYQRIDKDDAFLESHKEELEFLENTPDFRVLIGIRSDKMSLLDKLSFFLPDILKNLYELKALNPTQAREAIEMPPLRTGQFISPPFEFAENIIETIIAYLTQNGTKPIESFQLQIICKHIEDAIVLKCRNNPVLLQNGVKPKVESSDLGNLPDVIRDYYRNIVTNEKAFIPVEQLMARYFVEKRLIDERMRTRISLDKTFVEQLGISEDILNKLVDSRLVRREPNTVSGMSYELSHDTLVEPVLAASAFIGQLDANSATFFKQAIQSFPNIEQDAFQNFLMQQFFNENGNTQFQKVAALTEGDKIKMQALVEKNLVRLNTKKADDPIYELYYIFLSILHDQKRDRETKEKEQAKVELKEQIGETEKERLARKRASVAAIAAWIGLILAIFFSFISWKQSKELKRSIEAATFNFNKAQKAQNEKRAVEVELFIQNSKIYQTAKEPQLALDELTNAEILIKEGKETQLTDSLQVVFNHLQIKVDSFRNAVQK